MTLASDTSLSTALRWVRIAALAIFVMLCAAVLAQFSMVTHPRFITMKDSVDSQQAILEQRVFIFDGKAYEYPSWRNRLLVPSAIRTISQLTGISFSQAYILVRWITAYIALCTFGLLLHRTLHTNAWLSVAGALLFTVSLFPTFLHIYEIPSDFLDAAFFSLLVLCALEKRRIAFAALLMFALLNRESAIFATFVWFALYAWPFERRAFARETAFCFVLGAAGTAFVLWLRLINAVTVSDGFASVLQPYTPWSLALVHWRMIKDFFQYPMYGSPLFFLFGYLLFLALIATAYWRALPSRLQRLGLVAVAIYIVSLAYGNIDELRIFIPSLVICTLLLSALAVAEFDRSRTPVQ